MERDDGKGQMFWVHMIFMEEIMVAMLDKVQRV